jgi:hypothetical protein
LWKFPDFTLSPPICRYIQVYVAWLAKKQIELHMPPSVSVFTSLQPAESVALGRLVIDIDKPWQEFCPSSNLAITGQNIAQKSSFFVREILNQSKGTGFLVKLTKFFTSFYKTDESSFFDIAASEATTYLLLNSGEYFRRVCSDSVTKSWLEEVIKQDWPVYMVVGIHTVKNAIVVHNADSLTMSNASAQVPVTLASTSAGIPLTNDALDLVVDTSKYHSDGEASRFRTSEELVFAVQYRKVRFKWFSSKCRNNSRNSQIKIADNQPHRQCR